jgi:hypothetical protein
MKNLTLLIACFMACFVLAGQQSVKNDRDAIRELVLTAYVDGLHNKGDLEITRKGFFEGFDLLILQNSMVNKLPIYNWISMTRSRNMKDPGLPDEQVLTHCDFEFIDITGDAAVAKIHLSRSGEIIFTDYLMFYRFDEGWKIVGKIFHRIAE